MTNSFLELLAESEINRVPESVKPFLKPNEHPGNRQTWAFYSYGFAAAFEELLEEAIASRGRRDYLHVPLVFLCRHSVELALKHSIVFVSRHTFQEPRTGGHDLMKLWKELSRQIHLTGYSQDENWSGYCHDLIDYLQTIDRKADRFRYPSDIEGNPFPPDEIDPEMLGRLYWQISLYCDETVSMIDYSSPN